MDQDLVIDKAASVRIVIAAKHSYNITLNLFSDRARRQPLALTGTWKMSIASDIEGSRIKLDLTEGAGLTISGNSITISRTIILNSLGTGQYYYDLRNDNAGNSFKLLKGQLVVNPSVTS